MNSKEIGNLTELQCITYLYSIGCDVSIPFGNSQKYDLIIDWLDKLYKVQIKHANIKFDENGNVSHFSFKSRWQGHNSSGYTQTTYTKEDIDFFCTFYDGKAYLVPVEECSGAEKILRILPPKNCQQKFVNFASNYLAEKILKEL